MRGEARGWRPEGPVFESILFRPAQRPRGGSRLETVRVRWHESADAAKRAAERAVPAEASGAIAVRLEATDVPDAPPRQVVLYRYGQLPLGV